MTAASQLTLAEQLYLLACDEGVRVSGDPDVLFGSFLAGALLIELFHRELIYERPDGIVAVVERPGELPSLLEDAMTAICAGERSTERWATCWLDSELKPTKKTVAWSLVERGVLTEERGRMLGLIPRTRFPTADPAPRSELLERLHAVLLSTPRPDPTGPGMIQTRPRDPSEEEARLIALLELLDMIEPLVPPDRRRQARRRAEHLAGQGSPPSAGQATVWNVLRGPSQAAAGPGDRVGATAPAQTAEVEPTSVGRALHTLSGWSS